MTCRYHLGNRDVVTGCGSPCSSRGMGKAQGISLEMLKTGGKYRGENRRACKSCRNCSCAVGLGMGRRCTLPRCRVTGIHRAPRVLLPWFPSLPQHECHRKHCMNHCLSKELRLPHHCCHSSLVQRTEVLGEVLQDISWCPCRCLVHWSAKTAGWRRPSRTQVSVQKCQLQVRSSLSTLGSPSHLLRPVLLLPKDPKTFSSTNTPAHSPSSPLLAPQHQRCFHRAKCKCRDVEDVRGWTARVVAGWGRASERTAECKGRRLRGLEGPEPVKQLVLLRN